MVPVQSNLRLRRSVPTTLRCFVTNLNLKPTHKPVEDYYAALAQFEQLEVRHEGAVRSAFQSLLQGCARQFDWTLVPEHSMTGGSKQAGLWLTVH